MSLLFFLSHGCLRQAWGSDAPNFEDLSLAEHFSQLEMEYEDHLAGLEVISFKAGVAYKKLFQSKVFQFAAIIYINSKLATYYLIYSPQLFGGKVHVKYKYLGANVKRFYNSEAEFKRVHEMVLKKLVYEAQLLSQPDIEMASYVLGANKFDALVEFNCSSALKIW